MIKSVTIQNFKAIRSQKIDLERFTVFVGANGSGKTTVLQAVDMAAATWAHIGPTVELFVDERHCDWLYARDAEGDMSIRCVTTAGAFGIECHPRHGFSSNSRVLGNGQWHINRDHPGDMALDEFRQLAQPMTFLRLDESRLVEPHYSAVSPPRIGRDGQGLASVLAYMSLNAPDAFDDLQSHMRGLIPRLDRVRFDKAEVRQQVSEEIQIDPNTKIEKLSTRRYQGDKLLFDFHGATDIAAHAVSEGTLVLLGVLAVLLGPVRPRVLLLDDIERGLHPSAQHKLLDTLNALMSRFPDLQILATAHSPYLLDHLPPEQVRIMCIDDDGHSICGRLSDHPQFERWKDEMAPGEMWSLFGERWLAEGASAK